MAKIIINREFGVFGMLRGIIIELDGKRCAKVRLNGREECAISSGNHSIRARMDWEKSAVLQFDIKDGDVVGFACHAASQISLRNVYHTVAQQQVAPQSAPTSRARVDAPIDGWSKDKGANEHQRIKRPSNDQSTPWNLVLEVSTSASIDEIRVAYKQRIREYHPDKVAALGAEIRAVAERRSREINAAYEAAMKQA